MNGHLNWPTIIYRLPGYQWRSKHFGKRFRNTSKDKCPQNNTSEIMRTDGRIQRMRRNRWSRTDHHLTSVQPGQTNFFGQHQNPIPTTSRRVSNFESYFRRRYRVRNDTVSSTPLWLPCSKTSSGTSMYRNAGPIE